ncbi:MAG: hypothetical protein OEW85_06715 [Acidimicrobiia bacterium]|nr:hypothetical protein [Acidimicrobiia bacterium]
MPKGAVTLLAMAVAMAGWSIPAAGRDARQEAAEYLTSEGFTSADLARLEAGEVLARASQGASNEEILVAGAVKIRVSLDRVVSYYGQMITYVDGQVTLGFGRFSSPPALADVQGLAFDRGEVDALRTCRVGSCDIRLGGASLAALRSAIDWSQPGYVDEVNRFVRQAAVAYVADYQKRGDAALITYDDRSQAVSLEQQWQSILAHAKQLHRYAPELGDYLRGYPSKNVQGARDVFYWVKENYGMKPVISLVHGVIYQPAETLDRVHVVQKQLYASHYYDGSLAVGTVLGAVEDGAPVSYLLYGNRSRGDLLKGGFGGLMRGVARKQAQSAAEQTLGTIKQVLEQSRR